MFKAATRKVVHNIIVSSIRLGLVLALTLSFIFQAHILRTPALGSPTSVSTAGGQYATPYGTQRQVLRTTDANNTIHVFLVDSSGYIQWYRSTDNGDNFTQAFSSTLTGSYLSIGKDTSNNIHLVYENGGNVYYRKQAYDASSWGTAAQIDNGTAACHHPSIAIDGNGYIHVVMDYHTTSGPKRAQVLYNRSTNGGSSWLGSPQDVTTSEYRTNHTAGVLPSIVINNTNNYLYVTWFSGNNYLYVRRCVYSSGPTWTWDSTAETISSNLSSYGSTINTNMMHSAVFVNGKYRVVFCESGTAKYRDWDGSSWSSPILMQETVSNYPSLTYDCYNYLYVFYETNEGNSNYDICYQRSNNTTPSDFGTPVAISNDNTGNHFVNAKMGGDNGSIELIWTNGISSPYTIKYDSFCHAWSYSTGASTLSPPSINPALGSAFVGGNDTDINGMGTANGSQSWAAYNTGGTIQARSPVPKVKISGVDTYVIYAASSDGYLYAINASTGAALSGWPKQITTASLQGGICAQKNLNITGVDSSNTEKWVVFVGTYDISTTSSNKILALDAVTGNTLWTYQGGGSNPDMDVIGASPAADWSNNTVYFTSYANGGTGQPSLWAMNTTNGSLRWSKNLNNISSSPSSVGGNVYVGTNAGYLYKFDSSGNQKWVFDATGGGNIYRFPWAQGGKVYFSTSTTGRVYSVIDNGDSVTANSSWGGGTGYVTIQSPSAPLVVQGQGRLYVGSSDGYIYELSLSDGSQIKKRRVGPALGDACLDTSKGYLLFGSTTGKIYSYSIPF